MRVPDGSIYGFLGPNGAGKTTTWRLALGLLRRQEGSVSFFGRPFHQHRLEVLAQVGSLIESPSIYAHLSASENLDLLRRIYRTPAGRIPEVLALVGLADTGKKKAGEFSLGMKQRLALAAALLHRPKLLILDEPTNGLDPNGIIEMRELLKRLNREEGISIVVSSHLLPEIEKLVTHVGVIDRGSMIFQGTLAAFTRGQEERRSIVVESADPAAALRVAATEGWAGTLEDGRLVLPPLSKDDVARLTRRLVQAGIDVHAIGASRGDLESVFMDMINGEGK
jgi:ABC-2 type transport system ATP-binding protein